LIELLIDSLTVSPFFAAKKIQQRPRADLYFSIGKITTLTTALMHSFSV